MAQRSRKDGSHPQPLASRQINAGVLLRIMTKHDLTSTDAIGRYARIGLQTNSEIRRGTTRARTADHVITLAQGDGGAGGAGQSLRSLSDYVNSGFQIDFRR